LQKRDEKKTEGFNENTSHILNRAKREVSDPGTQMRKSGKEWLETAYLVKAGI
jgi:hypothetical protein